MIMFFNFRIYDGNFKLKVKPLDYGLQKDALHHINGEDHTSNQNNNLSRYNQCKLEMIKNNIPRINF